MARGHRWLYPDMVADDGVSHQVSEIGVSEVCITLSSQLVTKQGARVQLLAHFSFGIS